MPVRNASSLRVVAATGAALTLTAGIVLPALAAGEFRAGTTYDCNDSSVIAAVTFAVNTPPKTMAAGQTVKVPDASKVTLNADTTTFLHDIPMWKQVSGILSAPTAPHSGLKLTFPVTKLNDNGDGTTTAHATGNALLRATQTGTYTVRFGDVAATLQGYNRDGTKNGPPLVFDNNTAGALPSCVNTGGITTPRNTGGKATSVKVVKDRTTTHVGASYSRARHQIKATAKVRSKFGLRPTGTVKLTLKKGTHTIKTVSDTLSRKGIASAVFKRVRKAGTYTVKASYAGNPVLKPSSGAKRVTIG